LPSFLPFCLFLCKKLSHFVSKNLTGNIIVISVKSVNSFWTMGKNKSDEPVQEQTEQVNADASTETPIEDAQPETTTSGEEALKQEVGEMRDKYIRLYSEFENYKRRTAREKLEFTKTATENVLKELISVLDDFERAEKSFGKSEEGDPIRAGFDLIYQKLRKTLEKQGLQEMESAVGKPLDPEVHEAITQFPAPSEGLKGKVIDQVEKGYLLNEKVIRYAKVVVGM
jgi:molecular chaperone GrpE